MQRTTATATYHARILKLRLPEQDSLKDAAERCSADPVSLASIGRARVGEASRCVRDMCIAPALQSVIPLRELDAMLDPIHNRMQMRIEVLSGPIASS